MKLRLYNDTVWDNVTEHDVDDPESFVYGHRPTHILLSVPELRARDEAFINTTRAWDIREAHRTPYIYGYDAIIAIVEETP